MAEPVTIHGLNDATSPDIPIKIITDTGSISKDTEIKSNDNEAEKTNEKKMWKSEEFKVMEEKIHSFWKQNKTHEVDIDFESTDTVNPNKFFATFPYPYMNGYLHLGHGFTMSKIDFAGRYYRSMGRDSLTPFAFHCTGMPIVAAADKLKADILILRNNPSVILPEASQYNIMKRMEIPDNEIEKFTDCRYWCEYFPKCAQKTLERFGIRYDPRRSFVTTDIDPFYDRFVKWQFLELHKKNVLHFGTRYDMFSMKDNQPCLGHERSSGEDAKIECSYLIPFEVKGLSQGLTIVFESFLGQSTASPSGQENISINLVAMTTRPERLHGVTNLWVSKNGTYEIYEIYVDNHTDGHHTDGHTDDHNSTKRTFWICQQYILDGLIYQTRSTDPMHFKQYKKVGSIQGTDLIGSYVNHPFNRYSASNPEQYGEYKDMSLIVAHLNYQHLNRQLQVKMDKGTGIVMAVPADSPVDYLGYLYTNNSDATTNPNSVHIDMQPMRIVHVDHEQYKGSAMAMDMVQTELTKNNTNKISDEAIKKIKEFCYIGSEASSKFLVGEYVGLTVAETRNRMLTDKKFSPIIITYYEPDQEAYSRSGDRLIVAKMDQWYIDYGITKWKKAALKHLDTMKFTDETVPASLGIAINWLNQWPCTRTYGMGTDFPKEIIATVFNNQESHQNNPNNAAWKIDSLSDSTIYMALYTIYHLFAKYNIDPSEMTNDVFDYIFLLKHYANLKYQKWKPFQDEFIHWYPVDLRVSAKDLINNHLTMCIFNHVAVWDDEFMDRYREYYPEKHVESFGPVSYGINGYISVQKEHVNQAIGQKVEIEKMSKSKGNFKTLDQVIDLYTSDAVRFTFASASTGTSDSLFDQDLCKRMIEKFYKERKWIKEKLGELQSNRDLSEVSSRAREMIFPDNVFLNEMTSLVTASLDAYERMDFRDVVTRGFHIMHGIRDAYQESMQQNKHSMHPELIQLFIRTQLTLMEPIIPHFCEYWNQKKLFHDVMDIKIVDRPSLPGVTFGRALKEVTFGGDNKDNNIYEYRVFNMQEMGQMFKTIRANNLIHWQHKYLMDVSSDIAKRMLSFKKKFPIKKVIVFTAGEILDPFEKVADKILRSKPLKSVFEIKEIVELGVNFDPGLISSPKNNGQLIKYFKRFQGLITEYGKEWYQQVVSHSMDQQDKLNDYSEYTTLKNNLQYYLKRNPSDTYDVEIVNCMTITDCTSIGENYNTVHINEPNILFE